jgi:hypothetical protein
MAEFQPGQRVVVPNPNGEGTVEATFVGPRGEQAVDLPREADSRQVDVARIQYQDGTIGLTVYSEIRPAESGTTVAGGTPEHRWLQVYASDLEPILVGPEQQPLKILAANDEEASSQLDSVAAMLGVPREALTIKPPPGWAGYGSTPEE